MTKKSKRQNERFYCDEWNDGDDIVDARRREKNITKNQKKEMVRHGFDCVHCKGWVAIHAEMGTHNRNHCPSCLWSRHMDESKPGDRKSDCKSPMEPIALTFKEGRLDKYATESDVMVGALMLVHRCVKEGYVRINQVAADDNPNAVLDVFIRSLHLPAEAVGDFETRGITIARQSMSGIIMEQLFGKTM